MKWNKTRSLLVYTIMKQSLWIPGLVCMLFVACKDEEATPIQSGDAQYDILEQTPNLPAEHLNYANINLPGYLNTPPVNGQDNEPNNNAVTDAGATLGRVLFYDKNMSANNATACASCHLQAHGFSDPNTFSTGHKGGLTPRNSMGLINARYYTNASFFWDERAISLEAQTLMPIQDEIEMGMKLDELVEKLSMIDYYKPLFNAAFGDEEITADRVSKALSQFVRSMVSVNSKYDRGRSTLGNGPQAPDVVFANFSAEENRGKEIFFDPNLGGCAACHGTETFVAPGLRNNGLELNYSDQGAGGVSGLGRDNALFKSPSLKSIALTAPYMHDGRFKTLEEVVEHYNSGVQPHPNLSPPLRLPGPGPIQVRRLNLTASDKAALVAFLKTLTDDRLLTDERFADPFS